MNIYDLLSGGQDLAPNPAQGYMPQMPQADPTDAYQRTLENYIQSQIGAIQNPAPPQKHGFLDNLALAFARNPIQAPQVQPGARQSSTAAFLSGLIPAATTAFSGARVAAMPHAQNMQERIAGLKAASDAMEATAKLRALKTPGGGAKPSVLDQVLPDDVAKELGYPPGTTYRAASLRQSATRLENGANNNNQAALDPAVQNLLGNLLLTTGQIGIPLGRNPLNAVNAIGKAAISQSGGQMPNLGLAKSDFQANKGSEANVQKILDASEAFASTAHKNAQLLRDAASKIPDSGSPILNRPLRTISRGALGNVDLAVYQTAIETVAPEFARLLNSPSASGQLSDSARNEILTKVTNGDYSVKQLLATLDMLEKDAANRTQSYRQQVQDIRGRMGAPSDTSAAGRTLRMHGVGQKKADDYLKSLGF